MLKIIFNFLFWLLGILPYPPPAAPVPPQNPYFISTMQQRSYSSVVASEKLVLSTAQYNSYIVSFVSDGLKQYALMNVPTGSKPESGWPVVIINHGHIAPRVYSTTVSYFTPAADFAKAGFLVLKPDYRGHGESEGDADGLLNRLDYSIDVLNLLAGIKTLPAADPNRVYMWGHSMGGDVTLRAVEVCGNCIRAFSLWAPAVTDWPENMLYFVRRNRDTEWLNRVETELAEKFSTADYPRVSVVDNVGLIKVPLNLHHGTSDESVPYSWGEELAGKLTNSKITFTFYTYPADNHNLTRSWATAISRDVKLFQDSSLTP